MIIIKPIKSTEIKFLQDENTIYTCDFRAIGESMQYNIPAMWKYENLLPWILQNKTVVTNSDFEKITYPHTNAIIDIKKTKDAKISIYNRLKEQKINKKITKIYVAIPHPDADKFAENNNIPINYSYSDFLKLNDKFKQKELFGTNTPTWQKIKSQNELKQIIQKKKSGFIKRKYGSGGYTVFHINEIINNYKFNELFNESPTDWYFEEQVEGSVHSVQCLKYKNNNDIIIFGFSEQIICKGKYFTGSNIVSVNQINKNIINQLSKVIDDMKVLLQNFEGFFGIDFILDKNQKVFILEVNIRLTAVTIPTLIANDNSMSKLFYYEDIKQKIIPKNAIIIGYDNHAKSADIITQHRLIVSE